jgi:hypothetical protein
MKFESFPAILGLVASGLVASVAPAAAIPVTVNATSIIDIQSYNIGENAKDPVYLLVTGTHAGTAINERLPKDQTWQAAPKHPAVDSKAPVTLWKGALDDGQFVLLTVTLMQGKGADAALDKKYISDLAAADHKVLGWDKKTLTSANEFKKLAEDTLKADQSVVTNIKDLFSREKNTDHFGAQFTLIVWNNKGQLVKRLDPVGLTFGEHNGNDIKIYSKLKNTRNNVLMKNDKGEWEEQQLEPVNDDANAVRVKGLETEYVKQPTGNPIRHVTDYLVEVQVLGAENKPLTWTAEDEQNKLDTIHQYWNYAD